MSDETGAIISATIRQGGAGYFVGEELFVNGGSDAKIKITGIGSYGNVDAIELLSGGSGYSTSLWVTATGGSGYNLALDIVC